MGDVAKFNVGDEVRITGSEAANGSVGDLGIVKEVHGEKYMSNYSIPGFGYSVESGDYSWDVAEGDLEPIKIVQADQAPEVAKPIELGDVQPKSASITFPPPYEVPEGVVTMTRERLRDEFAIALVGSTPRWTTNDGPRIWEIVDSVLAARDGGS